MLRQLARLLAVPAVLVATTVTAVAAEPDLGRAAAETLRRATTYFDQHVACEGGCLWQYSADLERREGERRAERTQVWIQPPGTPTLGLAYLTAYERTGETYLLDLARKTAGGLLRGQLESGGWDYLIEFDESRRGKYAYRSNAASAAPKAFNVTTLDDNNTQSVLRFLMRLDRASEFKDQPLHEAVEYALTRLLDAQYPIGAWPQRFSAAADASQFPIKTASYPETWSRTYSGDKYLTHYTFNDGAMLDVIDVMLEAARIYNEPRYQQAAELGGTFVLRAQMPEPQPAWAQQYDSAMHPAWARKFEPPSITAGESQDILLTLIKLYRATGDKRFLEPIPRAVAWFKRSPIAEGQLARFYELHTNRPLYFTTQYALTYDDHDLPTHYGFKISSKLAAIEKAYAEVSSQPWVKPVEPAAARSSSGGKSTTGASTTGGKSSSKKRSPPSASSVAAAKVAIDALDAQGRWLETGRLKYQAEARGDEPLIRTATYVKHLDALSRYLAALRDYESR